jgi:hypothetical protein
MTRTDQATRRMTTGIVLAVALFAAGDSYSHIYDLARQHGQGIVSAALLPLAGDGLIAAASSAMLAAARAGKPLPARARWLLFAGIGATIAANVAYGLPQGLTGALLSVWPVAAYVGCLELLAWMREHLGVQPKPARATAPAASADAVADAPDDLEDRRQRKARKPLGELLRAAERQFPDAGTSLPSLRDIQGAMSVGQGKAQQVQAHFRSLAAG